MTTAPTLLLTPIPPLVPIGTSTAFSAAISTARTAPVVTASASSPLRPADAGDGLRSTLAEALRAGPGANPALDALLRDYARYHLVLAVVGGAFLAVIVALGVLAWRRFRRSPADPDGRRWTFARLAHLSCLVVSIGLALVLSLIVVANVSTALDPQPGFAGAVPLVRAAPAGTPRAELHEAFDGWLRSGSSEVPAPVQRAIDDRLSWQRPKAIISAVLLLAFAALAVRLWRPLLDGSGRRAGGWRVRDIGRLVAGLGTATVCLVLMLMVMGNTQASTAPLALTLFYG